MQLPKLYFHVNVAQVISVIGIVYIANKYFDIVAKSMGVGGNR